ncbi:hypothetical protein F511_34624 [Dorcoceras hygrometricum]|uniref:Uncharacterized protein n=1 Tax=Dorcoceras hygrometricum TaxID=472368 RepID=A0A2Z7B8D0_9LAMI|nr:hypothetical protein F511_34624 [Dorcoceras hygrometricum]
MAIEVFRPDSPSGRKSPRISFSFDQESSSPDELFSGGRILPTQIKKRLTSDAPPGPKPPLRMSQYPPHHECPEITKKNSESEDKVQKHKPSFWNFKRSTSLNCGRGGSHTWRLRLLPAFSRSYSKGSAATAKPTNQKQNIAKHSPKIHSEKSDSASYIAANHHRPPLKKNNNSSNNGVTVNPVLNIPQANIFGFGSIFSGGMDKEKNKNKKKH